MNPFFKRTSTPVKKPTTSDRASVHWQNLIWLIGLWTVVPAILRGVTIWQTTPAPGSFLALLGAVLLKMLAFLPQDLLIAAECVVVLWILKIIFVNGPTGDWGERLAAMLATTLYGCMQGYVLYDFLLYWKTGVRLELSMLRTVSPVELFSSTKSTLGLAPLLFSVGAVLALIAYVGKQFHDRISDIYLGRRQAVAFGIIAVAAFGSYSLAPAEARYRAGNVLLSDQINYCLTPFRGQQDAGTASDTQGLLAVFRSHENFDTPYADYPLYKETRGFTGEKSFDLKIGPQEKPHLIFFQIESFRAANVGVLGGEYPASPNFDELSNSGILFQNFYSNGVVPARSSSSSMYGIVPRLIPTSIAVTKPAINLIGMPELLHQRGYHNSLFYSGLVETENMGEFFRNHGFDEVFGVNDISRTFPKAARTPWGVYDEYLVHHVVTQLERQDKQQTPAFFYVQTSSNRRPWQVPPSYKPLKVDVPLAAEYTDYLKSFHYSDACLSLLMKSLHEKGLAKKTIVFIYGSSGMPMGEHHDNYAPINYAYEENFRVPLLILAPGRIDKPTVIEEPGSQMDLLPTVMDLFGLTGGNHALGSSLARVTPNRVVTMNNPFGSQYLAIRQARFKYVYAIRNNTSALFDLANDPKETRNIVNEHPALADAFHAEVTGLTQFMSRQYLSESFVPLPIAKPSPPPEPEQQGQ